MHQTQHALKHQLYVQLARDWPKGARVETHPATDAWMRGDRFGTVVKVGKRTFAVYVKMDRSGRTLRFQEHNLQPIGEAEQDGAR